jgi:hypothetical protein
MISYLSKPLESTVQPFEDNVALISQVAQTRQNKYDNVLDTIFQKENQLLNIDVSYAPLEVQQEKDNLLQRADEELDKLVKSDLLIPDNIQKAENIFTPIVTNEKIILGAQYTQAVKNNTSLYQEWRKDGKGMYNSANEAYTMTQANKARNMSYKDFKDSYQNFDINAVEFRDIDKEYREAAKTLGFTLKNTVQYSDPSGMYFITDTNQKLYAKDIMNILPNDAGINSQAKVNAWSSMGNVSQSDIIQARKDIFSSQYKEVKSINDNLTTLNSTISDNLKNIKANNTVGKTLLETVYSKKYPDLDLNTPEGKAQVVKSLEEELSKNKLVLANNDSELSTYDEYIKELDDLNKIPLGEQQLLGLKTQYYLENKKRSYGEAFKQDIRELKLDTNPYAVMNEKYKIDVSMEAIKHQNDIDSKLWQAEIDASSGKSKGKSSSKDSGEEETPEGTSLIPSVPEDTGKEEKLSYETLSSDIATTNTLVGKDEKDPNGSLFKSFSSSYKTASDGEATSATTDFQKDIQDYTSSMSGFTGDYNALSPDGHQTYAQVQAKYPEVKAYMDQRANLQSIAAKKQELIDKVTGNKKTADSLNTIKYSKEQFQQLYKTNPQEALMYMSIYGNPSTKKDVQEQANEKLKKLSYGTLSTELVPLASENAKDPARPIVQAAKNQIFAANSKLDESKIKVASFLFKNNNWQVKYNYTNAKGTSEVSTAVLSKDFVSKFQNDLSIAQPIEMYKLMMAEWNYNQSGDTYSLPNQQVKSQPIVMNGVSWTLLIDNTTSNGNIKLGKTSDKFKDYIEVTPEQAIGYITKGNNSSLSSTNNLQQLREKYLSSQK